MVLLPASECASNPKGASFELARDTFLAISLHKHFIKQRGQQITRNYYR